MHEVDRSRIITHQTCPRKRFLEYSFNGTGIQKKSKSLPLVLGAAYHDGIAELLLGKNIEHAVSTGLSVIHEALAGSGFVMNADDDLVTDYANQEQLALAEAMIRAYGIQVAPRFLDEFVVIEVEQEGRVDLGENITLMFRPDAVVREKSSGDYYVVSHKTTSTYGQRNMNQASVDMQSMSEVLGVSSKLGVPIEGVLYQYSLKGMRTKNEYLGAYTQNTPLVYGWKREGPTPEDTEYAWKYKWQTEEINAKTGKNVGTTLGKGFRSFPVWSEYPGGVKQWIEDLSAQRIEPRHINALEQVFPQTLPVSRRADEIDSWRTQVVAQEERVRNSVRLMELAVETNGDVKGQMDKSFPQFTHSCNAFNSRCSMWDICWNPSVASDPLGSGLYVIRKANHPENQEEE